MWLVALVSFGIVEHLIDGQTFPTVWLGMWWALATVTTVGYGDVVPQDSVGRVIASFLLLGGLALLSVVTATITSGFVARAERESRSQADAELLAESASCGHGSRSSPSAQTADRATTRRRPRRDSEGNVLALNARRGVVSSTSAPAPRLVLRFVGWPAVKAWGWSCAVGGAGLSRSSPGA